jgi:hypothetical protein
MECNTQKGETAAADFFRRLYRERRLTALELAARLRALDALDALASGKLRPSLSSAVGAAHPNHRARDLKKCGENRCAHGDA